MYTPFQNSTTRTAILEGRIVNTSSDSGPEWLAKQDEKTKNFFTKPELTMAELDLAIKSWCQWFPLIMLIFGQRYGF